MSDVDIEGDSVQPFSGIDAQTGDYLRPELPRGARRRRRRVRRARYGIDPGDLRQAGWAVVFGPDVTPAVREALHPLLARRHAQAGERYREVEWQRDERRARVFLARRGAPWGDADPEHFPYHVLLVGSPAHMPFSFQCGLSPDYSVGRLHFDTADEYAAYAATVLDCEVRPRRRTRQLAVFAPSHRHDPTAELSSEGLARPMVDSLRQRLRGWRVDPYLRGAATRARLAELLGGGPEPPDLLFTAGHGLHFLNADDQARSQGALLCSEWPGARAPRRRPPTPDEYLSADQIGAGARLRGAVVFNMACYSAGTQKYDYFAYWARGAKVRLTERAFVSPLPRRLLGRGDGALAVLGHVDTALLDPIIWPGGAVNRADFEDVLLMLAAGQPVGTAMEQFGRRHRALVADIQALGESTRLTPLKHAPRAPEAHLARNDARSYIVLGDPSVRLGPTPAASRPARRLRRFTPPPEMS